MNNKFTNKIRVSFIYSDPEMKIERKKKPNDDDEKHHHNISGKVGFSVLKNKRKKIDFVVLLFACRCCNYMQESLYF